MLLPQAATPRGWERLLADDAALRAGVDGIAQRHGLDAEPIERFDSGSLPVYGIGSARVLKLYPPHEAAHAEVEARVLDFVAGAVPAPEVAATGELDGWPYLLMSRLPGRRAVEVWHELADAERDGLADDVGGALAALHALDAGALSDLPPPRWTDFVPAQRASAVDRQRARGLGEPWLAQIDAFLDRWSPLPGSERVLLHTEIMREHLLVETRGGHRRLSGLFDFEPAMLGAREYEFASVGLFVTCGDARLLRRVLRAYGRPERDLDEALQRRLMAMTLLHRYSHLRWYLERLPLPGATTLEQLARHWFAL